MEQRAVIKFCFKLGKSASKTYELLQKARGSAELVSPKEPKPSKVRMDKSHVKTMFIVFFDAQGVIHREFVPEGQTVNGQFYLGVTE
jgi:hypothetical protein